VKKNLKKSIIPLVALASVSLGSCVDSDTKTWRDYADWREANDEWLHEQLVSGKYERIVPKWNENLNVLMRWENDRSETAGNLSPLYTSTVSVKYKGWLYDGTPFDSSYSNVDSLVTLTTSGLIDGWIIALEQMHVGDKVELIVPYEAGYGNAFSGDVVPFSVLRFAIELRDIPDYEVKPGRQ